MSYTPYIVSKSVSCTLHGFKKCLTDSLSVLSEVLPGRELQLPGEELLRLREAAGRGEGPPRAQADRWQRGKGGHERKGDAKSVLYTLCSVNKTLFDTM